MFFLNMIAIIFDIDDGIIILIIGEMIMLSNRTKVIYIFLIQISHLCYNTGLLFYIKKVLLILQENEYNNYGIIYK